MTSTEQYEILDTIVQMSEFKQECFYNTLRSNGLTEEDIFTIQSAVFYHKLFTDVDFYNAVKTGITEAVVRDIFN